MIQLQIICIGLSRVLLRGCPATLLRPVYEPLFGHQCTNEDGYGVSGGERTRGKDHSPASGLKSLATIWPRMKFLLSNWRMG